MNHSLDLQYSYRRNEQYECPQSTEMLCPGIDVFFVVHQRARNVANSALPSLTSGLLSPIDRYVPYFMLSLIHRSSLVPMHRMSLRLIHSSQAHTGISSCTDPWLGTDDGIARGVESTSRGSTVSQCTTQVWRVTSRLHTEETVSYERYQEYPDLTREAEP